MLTGKTIAEISVGDKASFTKTITDIDVWAFAGISGDFNPIHVNEEYAKNTRFGRRIAHGGVAMSLVGPVLGMMLPGPGTIVVDLYTRYVAPVYPLDTITCTVEVIEVQRERNRCVLNCEWRNQEGVVVIEGRATVMPPKQSA